MENVEREQVKLPVGDNQYYAEGAENFEREEPGIERLQDELAAEREQHLRTLAEFDNYRRRTKRERAEGENAGKRELLLELIDVMDDFGRAFDHVEEASDPVAEGLRMIHQRFQSLLQTNGVTPFESKGRPYDPTLHEALSVVETDTNESAIVYEEVQRGYEWKGVLLRPAHVVVVR